jgi:hypothetical protein
MIISLPISKLQLCRSRFFYLIMTLKPNFFIYLGNPEPEPEPEPNSSLTYLVNFSSRKSPRPTRALKHQARPTSKTNSLSLPRAKKWFSGLTGWHLHLWRAKQIRDGLQGGRMVCFQTKNQNFGTFWRAVKWKSC